MTNYHKELVEALQTILPTYYELTLTSKLGTPCISYIEVNNAAQETGDTLGYSLIQYQIKIWGNRIGDILTYTSQIDDTLRPLGWKRVSSRELYDGESTMIQKIMTYQALSLEEFNIEQEQN